jgi:Flagellar biosynthesis protein, FliO
MNELAHATNDRIAAIDQIEPSEDIGGRLESRSVRSRRRATKKDGMTETGPQTTRAKVEVSLQTLGPNPGAVSAFKRVIHAAIASAHQVLYWLQTRRRWQLKSRRLRLCETVSLGEKRFVAIVRVDDQQFLLGGALNSVRMLARLSRPDDFSSVLKQRRKRGKTVA